MLKALLEIQAAANKATPYDAVLKIRPLADAAITNAKTAGVELEMPPPAGLDRDTAEIEIKILEMARRRTVYADYEARVLKVDVKVTQRAIKNLKRRGMIYVSEATKPTGLGQSFKGFRATEAQQT